ncbi:unnamed protein product [Penicillium salamii]|nr:unnamed protein product [Penicillium salamii]
MPTHAARPANRLRKHNKSFTGCWTCRARKVKCSEQHPSCMQCINKGVPCGGYDIRLNWMTPETGFGDERQLACDDATQPAMSSRSQIVSGNSPPLPNQKSRLAPSA